MKVFILGGSGFVGGHLSRRLVKDGHQITIATRYAPGARERAVIPGVTLKQTNPYDLDSLTRALEGHDVAINLVGILNERGFGGRGFRRAHVKLVENLIISCEAARVGRLVHMSALNAGLGESYYLITRGQAEEQVMAAWRGGQLVTTILRPSTIFGPDDSFLNRFADLLKISPVLPLARPGAKFAPVYVGDVVEAVARALQTEDSHGRIYELGGSQVWTLKELVEWVAKQLELKRWVIGLPNALGWLQGRIFDFVPGKPFSSDNYRSLKLDSVCTDNGLIELGIQPWGLSEKAPSWLGNGGRQSRYQSFRRAARRDGN
ncbi:MAG: complex I NDUFA9 subunit family protein [Pseudomonadota bacterium]